VEQRLRAALRPVDPGAGFVGGVMARIAAERPRSARLPRTRAAASWLTFALAASIVLALLVAISSRRDARSRGSRRAGSSSRHCASRETSWSLPPAS